MSARGVDPLLDFSSSGSRRLSSGSAALGTSYGSVSFFGSSYDSSGTFGGVHPTLNPSPERLQFRPALAYNLYTSSDLQQPPNVLLSSSAAAAQPSTPHSHNEFGELTDSPWGSSAWNSELEHRGNSPARSVALLMGTTLGGGGGLMAMALCAHQLGWAVFAAGLVGCALCADISISLALNVCTATGVTSLESLGRTLWGRCGEVTVGGTIVLQSVGTVAALLDVSVAVAPQLAAWILSYGGGGSEKGWHPFDPNDATTHAVWVAGLCLVVLPLSMPRRLRRITLRSGMALLASLFLASVLIVHYLCLSAPSQGHHHNTTDHDDGLALFRRAGSKSSPPSALQFWVLPSIATPWPARAALAPAVALGVFAPLSAAVLPVYHESSGSRREGSQRQRALRSGHLTVLLTLLLAACIGIVGALVFGAAAKSHQMHSSVLVDMLDNMSYLNTTGKNTNVVLLDHVALLVVAVSALVTVPVVLFPARKAVIMTLFPQCCGVGRGWRFRGHSHEPSGRASRAHPVTFGTHLAVCTVLLGFAGGVSVLVPDALDVVVVFVPASALCACVLPAAFHLKLHGCCARDARGRVVSFDCMRFMSIWLVAEGVVVTGLAVWGTFT